MSTHLSSAHNIRPRGYLVNRKKRFNRLTAFCSLAAQAYDYVGLSPPSLKLIRTASQSNNVMSVCSLWQFRIFILVWSFSFIIDPPIQYFRLPPLGLRHGSGSKRAYPRGQIANTRSAITLPKAEASIPPPCQPSNYIQYL